MALAPSVLGDGFFFHLFGFLTLWSPRALHRQIADEEFGGCLFQQNDYFFFMVFVVVEQLSIQKLRFP